MSLDRLWAGWRRAYVEASGEEPTAVGPVLASGAGPATLFESILSLADEDGLIVHRGPTCSVLLNAYPYTNGHLLVVPNRGVAELSDLDDDEHSELWALVRDSVDAVQRAYGCDGVNIGMNLGRAAGAGVPDHLHAHVLPRWDGDTNFMTSVAETRVMPETLSSTWQRVRAAWPTR
jgi:ATP adenylyltransferase